MRSSFFLILSMTCLPQIAAAKAQSDLAYRVEEAFATSTRFVRVDRGCKIVDKDGEAAFVVFTCPLEEEKTSRGSLEIIRTSVRGQDGVRLQLTLPDEPHASELRWLELLERKLRDERGTPREAPKAPKPGAPPAQPAPDLPTAPTDNPIPTAP